MLLLVLLLASGGRIDHREFRRIIDSRPITMLTVLVFDSRPITILSVHVFVLLEMAPGMNSK